VKVKATSTLLLTQPSRAIFQLGCVTWALLGPSEAWRFLPTFPGKFSEEEHNFPGLVLPLGEKTSKSRDDVFASFSLSGLHDRRWSNALRSWLLA